MRIRSSIFAIGLLCGACAADHPISRTTAPVNEAPVIVRIVGRDTTITARAGANGPVYSMQDQQGKTIMSDMTLPQLQARNPELARHVKTMQASSDRVGWAGVE